MLLWDKDPRSYLYYIEVIMLINYKSGTVIN